MKVFFKNNLNILILIAFTFLNIFFFFYIKNSTHYMSVKLYHLKNKVETEKHNLSLQKAEFNKKYSIQKLQELAKDKLNLQFSNVNQIVDFEEILTKDKTN